uniref:protein S-acyltransferase n=1 Tax=Oncorhynchus mykiss TaxID=8022 RepID=A0A8L0DPX5_ONCMY
MFKNVFGSGFIVRTAHVILTWVITLILFLHDTDLRKQEERGELIQPVLFVLLVLVSVLLYFAVSLMDPGFVLSDGSDLQDMIPPTTKSLRQRRCGHCLLQQPMRSKHCQTCQHCVNHRCPFIHGCGDPQGMQCRILMIFLWLRGNGVLLGTVAVVAVLSLTVLLLLGSHLYLVSLNTTTWEFMSRHRISYLKHCGSEENPFDRGALRNLWGFFCNWGAIVWEQVYFREGNDPI